MTVGRSQTGVLDIRESPPVGTIVGVLRYPVKSMGAEALHFADIGWHGLAGDRRWAFVRPGLERSSFPWLTIRERPDMGRFAPRFAEPDRVEASATLVRSPPDVDGAAEYDVADPALAALLGDGVRVIKQNRGVFDIAPLSVITVQSIAALGELVGGGDLEPLRFRPNLVVDAGAGAEPFTEDAWVGRTLRAGDFAMRVDQRDQRCVMINVDPETGERDPRVLRAVAQERGSCLGVYGSTVAPGRVAVGDALALDPG